ncbi:T9SS type B sorting domain-containing protein [Tenacibaculum aestuarii]|uniref:T9SS type B sorting domain-containing protein n=1 Tax=Tenacibaculum aestuarii TaxID=362781 RepID=UPI003894BD54
MKRKTKSILILLALLLFCVNTSVLSQVLLKPELQFTNACNGAQTDFSVTFKVTALPNGDNTYTIELSDADGNWGTPKNVGSFTNANSLYTFSRSFQLPDNTYGANYKIRLVSNSPAMTSPDSDPFEAYKFSTQQLVLNNYENEILCGSGTVELTLNTNQNGAYQWYKDDVLVATTEEPRLETSESGTYQVKIDYGVCGYNDSTFMKVIVLTPADSQIDAPSTVEICGDESYEFKSKVSYPELIYKWYQDGVLKQSSNSPTYTTPTTGQFGTYHLVIDTGECTTTSNNVVLQQQTTAGFNVNTVGPLTAVILSGETIELCINHDASSGTVQWYKDIDTPLAARTQLCMNANEPGEYYARVTQSTGSSCDAIVDSDKYTLLDVKSFKATIRTSENYEACNSTSTTLSIVGVKAIATDDNEYDLTAAQVAMLNYQWNKDGVAISGATNEELSLGSYLDSGSYDLTVKVGLVEGISGVLPVQLVEVPNVSSDTNSNSLCSGSSITYTINNIIAGYTYQWIKDGTEDVTPANPQTLTVTEVGEYVLRYSGFGCDKELNPINVIPFDDSAVTITPSEKVVMEEGGSAVVVAAGGESYEWYQGEGTSGTLLSTTEELTVTTLGFYTVLAKVGNCSVERTIEVVEPDDQIIVPNTLTPNGDGKNDTWKISNKYAFQPLVTIMLYNANGKEIFKTTEYRNDWPTGDLGNQKVFYYKIIREDKLIKAGTISVLH